MVLQSPNSHVIFKGQCLFSLLERYIRLFLYNEEKKKKKELLFIQKGLGFATIFTKSWEKEEEKRQRWQDYTQADRKRDREHDYTMTSL